MSTYLNACDQKTASIRVRHRVLHLRNYSCEWCQQTLKQACFQEYPEAQFAFKNLMIHCILQFALRIAFRCVLHRCASQDIRCCELCKVSCHEGF